MLVGGGAGWLALQLRFKEVKDADDIGVLEPRQGAGFVQESLLEIGREYVSPSNPINRIT